MQLYITLVAACISFKVISWIGYYTGHQNESITSNSVHNLKYSVKCSLAHMLDINFATGTTIILDQSNSKYFSSYVIISHYQQIIGKVIENRQEP